MANPTSAKGVGVDGPRRHRLCQNEVVADLKQMGPSVEQISRIGMDTSEYFFQLLGVNAAEKVVLRKKLRSVIPKRKLENSNQRPAPASLTNGNVGGPPRAMLASRLSTSLSSAKIPQIGAFPDHRGVAAYSHLQDFGGDSDKSLCFPTTISFVYFLPPRAVFHW